MKPRLIGPTGIARRIARASLAALVAAQAGCRSPRPSASVVVDGGVAAAITRDDALGAIARAEDIRRVADLPAGAQGSDDVRVRRAAARALARILDGDDGPLLRALEDEDGEVVAWGSFGLGESCKGHEDRHARALAARLASFVADGDPSLRESPDGAAARAPSPVAAILRALGRCASDAAEATLRFWVSAPGEVGEAACYALADVAARRGALSNESAAALLAAALAPTPSDAALFAFGRPEVTFAREVEPRLAAAARAQVARGGPLRLFAIRALARTHDADAASDLARLLVSPEASPPDRIEAAAGLSRAGPAGAVALDAAVVALLAHGAPDQGDDLGVVRSAIDDLDVSLPPETIDALTAAAGRPIEKTDDAASRRRASLLRCAAAAKLARNAWDAEVLRACDVGDGEAGERARLDALDRGRITGPRRAGWAALLQSTHVQVREAAIEAIARHPELAAAAREAIGTALVAEPPGLVAAAAKVVAAHPERVLVPEPNAGASARAATIDPAVGRALRSALDRIWRQDLVEAHAAVLEAALVVGVDGAVDRAAAACADPNATLRARVAKALAATGHAAASCAAPPAAPAFAPEIGHSLARAVRVTFDTDAGALAVVFDPALAPVAATRFVALARTGFYTGVTFHRVVPGFVVQFGDPGGDGYGGSGSLLRCETSPAPFGPLDVGVALSGRDTGSSQIFVTLDRYPQLDGEYAWVGRAEGDWNAVSPGDAIRAVRVED